MFVRIDHYSGPGPPRPPANCGIRGHSVATARNGIRPYLPPVLPRNEKSSTRTTYESSSYYGTGGVFWRVCARQGPGLVVFQLVLLLWICYGQRMTRADLHLHGRGLATLHQDQGFHSCCDRRQCTVCEGNESSSIECSERVAAHVTYSRLTRVSNLLHNTDGFGPCNALLGG